MIGWRREISSDGITEAVRTEPFGLRSAGATGNRRMHDADEEPVHRDKLLHASRSIAGKLRPGGGAHAHS